METVASSLGRSSHWQGKKLQVTKVNPVNLLPEEEVLRQGFAGHTINDFPEPARSYNIAYARLAPVFQQKHVPLLIRVGDSDVRGVMNFVWSSHIGMVPIQRVESNLFEVVNDCIVYVDGDDLSTVSFAVDEILSASPPWCK